MAEGGPYLFPGPVLRRMSAEQAWDSCATLVVGADVDKFHAHRGAKYAEVMKVNFGEGINSESLKADIEEAAGGLSQFGRARKIAKKSKNNRVQPAVDGDEGAMISPPERNGLVLARASELPQPERDQHFLRMFGQSDREIADSSSDEGSIPQVLMLMNGEAQKVIGQDDSLVIQTATGQKSPEQQVESLYLSFFSRKPEPEELADAVASLGKDLTIRDLSWVLFNTREFVFVE
jgi:hypothetical protein